MKTSIPKTKLTKAINDLLKTHIVTHTNTTVNTDEYLLVQPFREEIVIPKKNIKFPLNYHRKGYKADPIVYKNRSKLKNIYETQLENIKNDILRRPVIINAVVDYTVPQFKEFNDLLNELIVKHVDSLDNFINYINTLYEEHSDVELLNAIKKVSSNNYSLREYIYASDARDVFIEMSKKPANRIPLIAYMKHENVRQYIPEDKIIHPGQIITAVKKTYSINDTAQWRTFIKFTPKVIDYPQTHINMLLAINETKVTKKLSRLISHSTVPSRLNDLYVSKHRYEMQENGDPEEAVLLNRITTNLDTFLNIIKLIYNAEDLVMDNFQYTISDILDYVTSIHRETGLYPKHYTWNAYIRNSRDWHYAQRRRRAIQNAGNRIFEWNSLLPEFTLDDYKITPLTDSPSLIAEGEVMRHCVGSYWRDAINNNYRLFHIEHINNPKDTGTLCLRPSELGVNVSQLRSYHNKSVSPELDKIARRVCTRYRNILKRTDTRLHIWNRTIDATTNDVIETKGFPEEDITKTTTDVELTDLDENDDTT